MNNFTPQDIQNIIALINLAPIKGGEATTVALLQQKLAGLLPAETPAETKEKKK